MEADFVCGNFFEAWGSPTKNQSINDSFTNNTTLLNNIHVVYGSPINITTANDP